MAGIYRVDRRTLLADLGRGAGAVAILGWTACSDDECYLRANKAHDNADDGIEVQGVQTRLADNTANANGDFGIDAVAGVTDGGGNTASGNGNPLQCRNVFCAQEAP